MTDDISLRVEGDGFKVIGKLEHAEADHLLRNALDDIADQIQETASLFAPGGETGELKEHPTDRKNVFGIATREAFLFGGGIAVRGETGFIPGRADIGSAGKEVAFIEITVAKKPKHATWVHEGTGIFGEHHTPIVSPRGGLMKFNIGGKWFKTYSVKGQHPQPYLTEAYYYVDHTYVPHRVERLRAEIAAFLS